MKKITNLINRFLLALIALTGIAMFFFMADFREDLFTAQVLNASLLLLLGIINLIHGVIYPDRRDEVGKVRDTFLKVMEFLTRAFYHYPFLPIRPETHSSIARRHWEPMGVFVLFIFYIPFGILSFVIAGTPYRILLIVGGILLLLMIITSFIWKMADNKETTGQTQAWLVARPLIVVIAFLGFCTIIALIYTFHQSQNTFSQSDIDALIEQSQKVLPSTSGSTSGN